MNAEKELLNELRIERGTTAPTPSPQGARWRWWLAPLAMTVVGMGIWWSYQGNEPMLINVASAQPVQDAPAADRGVLNATGYITARRQATVSSEITGKVVEVMVEEGMVVESGQLLARLDDSLLQAALSLSQAQLDAARSNLAEVRVALVEGEANLARIRDLAAKKLASAQALDESQANVDALKARLSSLEKAIVVAERSVEVQQQQWDDTLIRAPFAGVVIDKAAQPGEMISPVSAGGGFTRTGICTIVDMQSLEIEVDVSESYINRVSSGQPVEAVLNSYPDWRIPAEVITIIPAADRNRATVRVRIRLLQQDDRVLPDMGVKVTFLSPQDETELAQEQGPQGMLVPASAVSSTAGANRVYVFDGEAVQQRTVQVGERLGDRLVITAGLRQGEQVVTGLDPALIERLEQGGTFIAQR